MTLCALTLLAGCSIDFDRFLRGRVGDAGAPDDTGVIGPADMGVAPVDTGVAPVDTGVTPPRDTGVVPPVDTGVMPPRDTGVMPPVDTGVVTSTECRAPYLVAVAEDLDRGTGRLLRWSFADDRRCADLGLTIVRPRSVGVAFDGTSSLTGPQLIVVDDTAVSVVNPDDGSVVRDVAVAGAPRSVFDIVSNGSGTFAVAYTFAGGSNPGSVGNVRVFDHRAGNLREVQAWNRNMQFGLSVLWMTAFPGNQGQYLQLRNAETGSGYSAVVMSPVGTGFHQATTPALIANRNNAVSMTAYRSADRRGRYAMAFSGNSSTPAVYVASTGVSSSSLTDVFVPTVRCPEACPAITRAVAFPDENGQAAAICELTGTEYTVVRVGGASTGCRMLDTSATPGRWRIHDLAVMPL
ncbi:MAG: hypothetical protein Q8S73_38210 [Deltaproteobacteria bacterium]|nr:hypothetical protein [Deltaproteobacteria bacterium]